MNHHHPDVEAAAQKGPAARTAPLAAAEEIARSSDFAAVA
jgi:hypothetical protein